MKRDEDEAPWNQYKKGVKRLQATKPTVGADKTTATLRVKRTPKAEGAMKMEEFRLSRDEAGGGVGKSFSLVRRAVPQENVRLDRKTERAMRTGEIEIDAKLDLHGKTEREAHAALVRFIEKVTSSGCKWVLVVTGKGRGGTSVLRANFPRWCGEEKIKAHILTLRPAAPCHGGDGAFYVRLRKRAL